jgi:hypothetical protein
MNGQQFLEKLAEFPSDTFEYYFSQVADSLCLGEAMEAEDLRRLSEAALWARFCNISFNGLGGCNGEIKPQRERHRITLEQKFMARKEELRDCAAWHALSSFQRDTAARFFLDVFVAENNLALEP